MMLSTCCFQLETISFRVEKHKGGKAGKYSENADFSLTMFILSRTLSDPTTQFTLCATAGNHFPPCGDFCSVSQADFVMLLVKGEYFAH